MKKVFVYLLFFISLGFSNAFAQNKILLKSSHDSEAIPDALVYINTLGKGDKKLYYSNQNGEVDFYDSLPIAIEVIANKFKIYRDTVYTNGLTLAITPSFSSVKKVVISGGANPFEIDKTVNRIKIIDQKKIKEMAAQTLDEALANEINININQDPQLGAGMSLRGVAGQQVKILMDGIPMIGRNNGTIDLSQINMNNVSHIEIIEGPMSLIYGSDAAGGIINIITKRPTKDEKQISLNQFASTRGAFNSNANVNLANKNNQLSIGGTRYLFQGYDENSEVRNPLWRPKRQYIGNLYYNRYINNNFKQSISLNYFNEYLIAKGTPIIDQLHAIGIDDYFTTNRMDISGQTFYKNTKKQLFFNLTNAYNTYERFRDRRITNLTNLEQTPTRLNDGNDIQLFTAFNSRLIGNKRINDQFKLGFGYDINLSNGTSDRIIGNPNINDYAAFYNVQFNYKKFAIEQGLRLSYNNQFKIPVTPALHIKYDIRKNWNATLSYANGFRTPSLKERFLFFVDQNHDVTGNPNLSSETSNSYNLTLKHQSEKEKTNLNFIFNGFYTSINDMIVLAARADNPNAFTYENIETFQSLGMNSSLNLGFKNLETTLGLGLIGTNQLSDSIEMQDKFLFTPTFQLNLNYTFPKLKLSIASINKFNGAVPNYFKENNALKLQYSTPFMMSDITVMRNFAADKISIALSIKNLFNITNIQNTNNLGGVHSAGANSAAVAMGRFIGLNVSYRIGK